MTAPWMLHCVALSLLVGVGAAALERALHALGRPVRGAWAGAILLSLLLPFLLRLAPPSASPPAATLEVALGGGMVEVPALAAPAAESGVALLARRADALLLPAWGAASLLLLAVVGASLVVLHLRRRGWRWGRVAGAPVRISPSDGPAVVGLFPGEIVLPEWTLSLDEARQRLIVEHEREHLRAGDPLLLFAALVAAVLVPWNPALWWQLRRLRLAVEIDCDARVLRRSPDVRAYGFLLLDVGRLASSGRLAAAALSEPQSFLERRIRMMTSPRTGRGLRAAAIAAAACATAVATAAALPLPEQPEIGWGGGGEPPAPVAEAPLPSAPALAPDTIPVRGKVYDVAEVPEKPKLVNGEEVRRLLESLYPPLLKSAGVTGSAMVTLVINHEGRVAETRVVTATHEPFGEAAREVVRRARFRPAKLEGSPVAVRVTMPVSFTLDEPMPRAAAPLPADTLPPPAGVIDVSRATEKPRLLNAQVLQQLLQQYYPPLLRDAGVTGSAMVQFVLDEQGVPRSLEVRSATHEAFGDAAVRALREARFRPAKQDGKLVAVRITMPVGFSLPTVDEPPPGRTPGE